MTLPELHRLYSQPFFDLLQQARQVHEEHWPERKGEVQLCTLLSIKTGGCSEDCSYCAQSAHYATGVPSERLMETADVLEAAHRAKENGSTRFCMGGGVARGARRDAQVRERPGDRPRRGGPGHGSLCHPGDARPRGSPRPGRGGGDGLQPQPRHLAGILPRDRHHPHLPGPVGYPARRRRRRDERVLRRDRRPGRERHRPAAAVGGVDEPGPRPGERAHQLPHAHARDAPGRAGAGGHLRPRAAHRRHPPGAAQSPRAALRRTHPADPRGAGVMLLRRGELDLLRGTACSPPPTPARTPTWPYSPPWTCGQKQPPHRSWPFRSRPGKFFPGKRR